MRRSWDSKFNKAYCMLYFFKECGVLFRMSVRLIEVPLSSFLMKVYSCLSSRFNFNWGSTYFFQAFFFSFKTFPQRKSRVVSPLELIFSKNCSVKFLGLYSMLWVFNKVSSLDDMSTNVVSKVLSERKLGDYRAHFIFFL